MSSQFIVDVSEADFDVQVLAFSQDVPVLVDFWAPWCAPCRVLGPILEKLAIEYDGRFRLAKVNVDENPNLARRYQVRGIPAVKAFREGRLVSELAGAVPEPKVREFLRALTPSQNELDLARAQSLLFSRQTADAESAYRKVLLEDDGNPAALLGLARSLLLQGQSAEALFILKGFPASREYNQAEILRPLAEMLERHPATEPANDDLAAAFQRSLGLVRRGNVDAALDGLLDILRQDRRYMDGAVRRACLALLELKDPADPETKQYRSELAAVLF